MPESNYRNAIRANVRALWGGLFTLDDFYEGMDTAIRLNLRNAFIEAAKECGISPTEFTPAERAAMRTSVQGELGTIWNFGVSIQERNKASGAKLASHMTRAQLWILRYRDVMNKARVMVCGDGKLLWELGATEKHCTTCSKLHGKVKRASQWLEAGIQPQNPPNPVLECGGWRCDCRLTPTDLPMSRGILPR